MPASHQNYKKGPNVCIFGLHNLTLAQCCVSCFRSLRCSAFKRLRNSLFVFGGIPSKDPQVGAPKPSSKGTTERERNKYNLFRNPSTPRLYNGGSPLKNICLFTYSIQSLIIQTSFIQTQPVSSPMEFNILQQECHICDRHPLVSTFYLAVV